MKGFVTIQEAVKLTGTSDSTVRRWLRQLNSQDQKHVRRSGQRLFIDQSFLEKAFKVEDGAELAEYIPQRQEASADLQHLLQRQQDNIDRLLEENSRKDADLKDAWTMIQRLKEEALSLAYQVKALQAGNNKEEKSDQLQRFAVIALLVIIGALVIYLVFLAK